jgi:hypothetical protein
MRPVHRLVLVFPFLLLAAVPVPQGAGDKLTVTRKETSLRAGKRVFAPAVAALHEGDKLDCLAKDGPWLQARFQDTVGWVHESDVTARTDVRLSGEGVRETYSASETGAARKGFNPQVERTYRENNPDLAAAFKLVDEIQARKVSEADVKAFLEQGGLLGGGR